MPQQLYSLHNTVQCRRHLSDYHASFQYKTYPPGTHFHFENEPVNMLLYVLTGELRLKCNEHPEGTYHSGQMVFIPKSAIVDAWSQSELKILNSMFDGLHHPCDRLTIQSYLPLCKGKTYEFKSLDISPKLEPFFTSLVYYLREGTVCSHFLELKMQETLLMLRAYHSKEELASFFHPIVGESPSFKSMIMENYLNVSNVSELAEICNMGRTNFDLRFKQEFGMPARQWMLKQLAKHVKHHLSEPGATISDVMFRFKFNSPTHFNRFCKQQFGMTPTELITANNPKMTLEGLQIT